MMSLWMDLGRCFFFRLPLRGLMTSSMSSISLSCFLRRYSYLMYSLLAFSSSFFCCSSSAFSLHKNKKACSGRLKRKAEEKNDLDRACMRLDTHVMQRGHTVQLLSSAPGPALAVASSLELPSPSEVSFPTELLSLPPCPLLPSHHPGVE